MTLHPCFQPASPQLPISTPLHINYLFTVIIVTVLRCSLNALLSVVLNSTGRKLLSVIDYRYTYHIKHIPMYRSMYHSASYSISRQSERSYQCQAKLKLAWVTVHMTHHILEQEKKEKMPPDLPAKMRRPKARCARQNNSNWNDVCVRPGLQLLFLFMRHVAQSYLCYRQAPLCTVKAN